MRCTWIIFLLLTVECTGNNSLAQTSRGCTLAAWVMQQTPHTTRTPEAPPPTLRDTVITVNEASQHISLPEGFSMTVFARNIPECRGLCSGSNGIIYATTYKGYIYELLDRNHDGFADTMITIDTGLGDPDCIGFYHDTMYVSNDSALYQIIRKPVGTEHILIVHFPPGGSHSTRNFLFDTVNGKVYVQIGSNGNLDTTDFAQRARIIEMNPDGTDYRSFASGLRNCEGMDFDPRTGALWANNNGMDDLFGTGTELTDNNPSESIYLICDGANYGWPYCYAFQLRNPNTPWVNLDTNIVKTFDGPVAEILAHSAPLSLHFYRGTTFPAMYHNAIFQCYHGSWDRSPPAPPRITVMWADTDGKNARVTDFVNGFEVLGPGADSNTATYFGRPVQIIEGADSALYVSDDQEGCIYRIAYTGGTSSVTPQSVYEFGLSAPVPDPTNRTLRTTLTISNSSTVYLEIVDPIGNIVATRGLGQMLPGEHPITLDVSTLLSGTYFLRIIAGPDVASRTFSIVR